MNSKQLINVIKAMRLEIINIIDKTNFKNQKEIDSAILKIRNMFGQLDAEFDEGFPDELVAGYYRGLKEADRSLRLNGINYNDMPKDGNINLSNHVHINAIAEITDNTMLDLKSAIRTAELYAIGNINEILDNTKSILQSGVIRGTTRRALKKEVMNEFLSNNMTAFITSDGKRLPLDFYAETVVRTNLRNAHTKGGVNRYIESGQDLVKISGNTPTCESCWAYRDLVFSLSGNDTRFPKAGRNLPPYHPNCQCVAVVWVETYKTDKEINDAIKDAKTFNPNKDTRPKAVKEEYERMQGIKRRMNTEKKEYEDIIGVMGKDAPKTLGGYRRMKRSGSENYKELRTNYLKIKRNENAE